VCPAPAWAGGKLKFEGACSATPGSLLEFKLTAAFDQPVAAGAYQADVVYDQSVLQLVGYRSPFGSPFDGQTYSRPGGGTVSTGGLACGTSPPTRGPFVLGKLRFQVVGAPGASTGIDLGNVTLVHEDGTFEPLQTSPFSFKVSDIRDGDCDGVADSKDNCPEKANPGQEDVDANGVGDVCETNNPYVSTFTVAKREETARLRWTTLTEPDIAGFNVYRASSANGPWVRLTPTLVAARGSSVSGAAYTLTDRPGRGWRTVYYLIEVLDVNGESTRVGPAKVTLRKERASAPPAHGGEGPPERGGDLEMRP
jgi:hypothetical protein